MRYVVTILIFLFVSTILTAQSKVEYSYDQNGNRTSRTLTVVQLESTELSKADTIREQSFTEEIVENKDIKVFPNPVKSSLTIQITGYDDNLKKEAVVFDLSGNKLKQENVLYPESSIYMGDLREGIYFLMVTIGNEVSQFKIIKSK